MLSSFLDVGRFAAMRTFFLKAPKRLSAHMSYLTFFFILKKKMYWIFIERIAEKSLIQDHE